LGLRLLTAVQHELEVAQDELAAKVERDVQPLETVGARR